MKITPVGAMRSNVVARTQLVRSNCDDMVSKMILWDSFKKKFGKSPELASNRSGIATKWNRLESLLTLMLPSRRGPRGHLINQIVQRVGSGRGASNPSRLVEPLPHRGHPEIFRDSFSGKFSGGWGGIKSLGALGPVTARGATRRFFLAGQNF
jgi:hypothetical protein